MPAPANNHNAMAHGLAAGKLPDGCSYIAKLTKKFRTSLEAACIARHGGVSLTQAATIQSIIRWERHSMLCQRWLRVCPGLSADQQMAFSRDAARASAERDKCLRMLDLDAKEIDPIKALAAEFAAFNVEPQPTPPADAAETASEPPEVAEGCSEPPTHPGTLSDCGTTPDQTTP
jgi:hypothetical protein